MSSSTMIPQELYEKEKDRTMELGKKVGRLEAQLEHREGLLKNKTNVADMLMSDLDLWKADYELIKEQNEDHETTIDQLQMALDNADQPRGPGDDDQVKELQTKVKLLEGQNKELKKNFAEAVKGDWAKVVPLLDEDLKKGTTAWISKFNASQANLTKANTELESCKREFFELQEYNEVLLRQFDIMEDHVQNHKDIREANATQEHGSVTKLMKVCYIPQRKPGASTTKPTPNTQGVGMQSSASPSAPPPVSQSSSGEKGKGVQQAKTSPNTAPESKAVEEDPEQPQQADDQGFTPALRGRAAPATRGPKQETFEQQAASKNPFAPLVDDEERTPKSDTQGKKPTESRKHVPSLASIDQNAAERDQKVGNAGRQSAGPKTSKAPQSMKVPVFGPAPVPKVPAPALFKAPARLQNKGSASKPALPATEQAWAIPKSSFNPITTPIVPASSKSFAQTAVDPPKPVVNPAFSWLLKAAKDISKNEQVANSKVPDKKKMMDAVAGKVVEPEKPKLKLEPAPQSSAHARSGDSTPPTIEGQKSSTKLLEDLEKHQDKGKKGLKRERTETMEAKLLEPLAKYPRLDLRQQSQEPQWHVMQPDHSKESDGRYCSDSEEGDMVASYSTP